MTVATHDCGCTFDDEFVTTEHQTTAPFHRLLKEEAKPAVTDTEPPAEFMAEEKEEAVGLLSRLKGKKSGKDD